MIPAQALFARAVQLDFQQAVAAQSLSLSLSLKLKLKLKLIVLVDITTSWIHRAFHQCRAVEFPRYPRFQPLYGLAGRLVHKRG